MRDATAGLALVYPNRRAVVSPPRRPARREPDEESVDQRRTSAALASASRATADTTQEGSCPGDLMSLPEYGE